MLLFLTLMAAGGSLAVGMLFRYAACFERLTVSIQNIIHSSEAFLLVARRQSVMFEFLDTKEAFMREHFRLRKEVIMNMRLSFGMFPLNIPEAANMRCVIYH